MFSTVLYENTSFEATTKYSVSEIGEQVYFGVLCFTPEKTLV